MKRSLVLSGGGAKGAFEVGALQYIEEQRPAEFNYNNIAGVSVGALNGAMMAQKKFEQLKTLWNQLSNDKVYTGRVSVPQALWRIVRGKKSILGIEPLIRQIESNIDIKDIVIDFRCGIVSLHSGEYHSLRHTDFGSSNNDFRNAILASATMPIIWEPVKKLTTTRTTYTGLVDGGVRNVSPLKDIIADNPDEIVIINCSNEKINSEPDAGKNIFKIALRTLTDITINEIFRTDIEEFVKVNEIVEQCTRGGLTVFRDTAHTKPYKYFKAIIIEPEYSLGDSLDFSQTSIQQRWQAGYKAAQAAYAKFNPAAGVTMARSFK
jgi:NTE family protein